MALKYYDAASSLHIPPEDAYKEDYAEMYDYLFANAPNAFRDVEIEKEYGTKCFIRTRARIDAVVSDVATGLKVGNDFKHFVFPPDNPRLAMGDLIRWKNSYWLVTSTNDYGSISNGCVARRCNNLLRWIDDNGNIIIEPCILDYQIGENMDYKGKELSLTSGFQRLWCQKNLNTISILPNKRFIFGVKENPRAFRIAADGIRNFLNTETECNYSKSMIELSFAGDYFNDEVDNAELLIADYYRAKFSIKIEQDNIEQVVGFKTQLVAIAQKDGKQLDVPIKWESDNKDICEVDSEGNIELKAVGQCKIMASFNNNKNVSDSIDINVVENINDVYDVVITPIDYKYTNEILQGDTVTYECKLYKNSIELNDTFEFVIDTDISYSNYIFNVIDGNKFYVKNIRQSKGKLVINCISGEHMQEYIIKLKGSW